MSEDPIEENKVSKKNAKIKYLSKNSELHHLLQEKMKNNQMSLSTVLTSYSLSVSRMLSN